jgi:modulator of FtsH protease
VTSAFEPGAWSDLYLMVGGAAAALTGLIFVAVSLHLRAVLRNPWHRGTAASSLLALMSVVLISGSLLVPSQPLPLLGAEIALISIVSPAYNAVALRHLPREKRTAALAKVAVGMAGGVLAISAGISLATPGRWRPVAPPAGRRHRARKLGAERMASHGRRGGRGPGNNLKKAVMGRAPGPVS